MLRGDLLFIRNGTRRATAQIVRHHRSRQRGATMYAAILLLPDGHGGFIEVRDPLYTPFPKPVIGERVAVVHPDGYPGKARIPYPVFRAGVYVVLGFVFVRVVMEITGLG